MKVYGISGNELLSFGIGISDISCQDMHHFDQDNIMSVHTRNEFEMVFYLDTMKYSIIHIIFHLNSRILQKIQFDFQQHGVNWYTDDILYAEFYLVYRKLDCKYYLIPAYLIGYFLTESRVDEFLEYLTDYVFSVDLDYQEEKLFLIE